MTTEEEKERFLKYLRFERGYSENTLKAYSRNLDGFLEFLDLNRVKNISNVDFRLIHRYMVAQGQKKLSAASIEQRLATLRSFFAFLVKTGVVMNNPAELISAPKKPGRLPDVLSVNEMMKLLSEMPENTPLEIRSKAILTLMYAAGIRVSECAGLDLTDVDFESERIRVLGKGSKERVIPAGKVALKMLKRYLGVREELIKDEREALFLTKTGKRISTRAILTIVKDAAARSGCFKNVHPHTFRHSYATHLLKNGASIRVIQELLGHSSLSTTQVYTHLSKKELKENFDRFHPHS